MNPTAQLHPAADRADRIATYRNADGECEIVLVPAIDGTLLVDQMPGRADARLVARIEADEPDTNIELLARMYVADPT